MVKFSANLSMLFNEYTFLDRFARAKAGGFEAVEFMFPYGYDAQNLLDLLKQNALKHVLHNLPAGNWDKGERGIACLSDRVGEFQDGVDAAIEYAKVLGNNQINCLIGKKPADVDDDEVYATVVSNLKFAASALAKENIKLLVEPINNYDIPGFYLQRTAQALELIADVGSDNLYIQYDIYHMQRTEGELAATIEKNLAKIAHIQIADNPGRNEPGTGEINYHFLFEYLTRIGYTGWIGCEYKPKTTTEEGLGWLKQYK